MVVTGANSGIGYETARALAGGGARVILACRELASAERAAAKIRSAHPGAQAEARRLDLASLASVREFSERLDAGPVSALICNAGVYGGPTPRPRTVSSARSASVTSVTFSSRYRCANDCGPRRRRES